MEATSEAYLNSAVRGWLLQVDESSLPQIYSQQLRRCGRLSLRLSLGGERVDRLQEPSARDFDPLAIHPAVAFGKKGRDHWADIAR